MTSSEKPKFPEKRIWEVSLTAQTSFAEAEIMIENREGGDTVQIYYEASGSGKARESGASEISTTKFNELVNLIKNYNFWSFKRRYADENIMDAVSYTVTVKSTSLIYQSPEKAQAHAVTCYGVCPAEIGQIINRIERLWGREILTPE